MPQRDDRTAVHTKGQQPGILEHNFRALDMPPKVQVGEEGSWVAGMGVRVDWATYRREMAGMSAFPLYCGCQRMSQCSILLLKPRAKNRDGR